MLVLCSEGNAIVFITLAGYSMSHARVAKQIKRL